ncbi:MAG: hypothetical protein K0S11_1341 [Gammaproteobacteria bacterium]|jgi:hypothetical protein|nr:hypothetical protein [Gammaproteobacteria bacterium]
MNKRIKLKANKLQLEEKAFTRLEKIGNILTKQRDTTLLKST